VLSFDRGHLSSVDHQSACEVFKSRADGVDIPQHSADLSRDPSRFSFCEESFRITVAIATPPPVRVHYMACGFPLDGIEIALSSASVSVTRAFDQRLAETSLR